MLFEPGLSNVPERDFAMQIIAGLKQDFGVDILPIINDSSLTSVQIRQQASAALLKAAIARGRASEFSEDWGSPADDDNVLQQFVSAEVAAEVDIEPNIAFLSKNVPDLAAMQGSDVKDFVFGLAKRFESASKSPSIEQLVAELLGGSVVAFSVSMGTAVYKALRAGETLRVALRAGITGIGFKTVIAVVLVTLVAFILWLIFENPKKCLGLIVNDTVLDLYAADWRKGVDGSRDSPSLFMNQGTMIAFMEDFLEGDLSRKVQIKGRMQDNDPEKSLVWAGIYYADKKTGTNGAEGLIYLTTSQGEIITVLFVVPYSKDNGTYIGTAPDHVPASQFRSYYDMRKVRVDQTISARFVSTMNSNRGGVVACLSVIELPPR